jgi:hypothetical protein
MVMVTFAELLFVGVVANVVGNDFGLGVRGVSLKT